MSGAAQVGEAPGSRPLRVGVSQCLLGDHVRHDGGHKRDPYLTLTLSRFVEWVPVCPEVEMGLGTPRETLRLVREGDTVRFVSRSGLDHTDAMRAWSRRRLRELSRLELCGYVLKKDSPSCGMERVRVHHGRGAPSRNGRGLFAEELMAAFPGLPVEEEGRLTDPRLRESFIERLFAFRRLRDLFSGRFSVGRLVAFHTAHKMLLLAHSPVDYRELGRLVARARELPADAVRKDYARLFMQALAVPATPRRHTNVLQHMLGHFSQHLDAAERGELLVLIEDYRRGLVPLVVPLTLVRHHVVRHDVAYLRGQVYLEPHPKELMLRNHV